MNAYFKRTQACFRKSELARSWINHIVCACSGQTFAVSAPSASPAGSFLKRAHQWDAMMSFPHCQYGCRECVWPLAPLHFNSSNSVHYLIETHICFLLLFLRDLNTNNRTWKKKIFSWNRGTWWFIKCNIFVGRPLLGKVTLVLNIHHLYTICLTVDLWSSYSLELVL